jgi:RNA polymerase sigma factor (sigma-70 family)
MNVAIDRYNAVVDEPTIPLEDLSRPDPDDGKQRPIQEFGAEEKSLDPLLLALGQCLARLSDEDRTLVRLFHWEGLSCREISVALGTNEESIKKRLQRARAQLRSFLEGGI